MRRTERDWNEVQKFLDETGRINLTLKRFSLSRTAFNNAVRDGLIVKNLKPRKHTKETKDKLSNIRKDFLRRNPDKHPWKTNDKFKSEPCEALKNFLRSKGFVFEEEYSEFGRHYSIDIAFPKSKIAIEVNGNQHYNRDGSLKDYYQIRDNYFKNLGWTTLQIPYLKVYSDSFRNELLLRLQNMDLKDLCCENENVYVNVKEKVKENVNAHVHTHKYYYCKNCGKKITKKLYNFTKMCKGCRCDEALKNINIERVFIIAESNLDFTEWGVIKKLSLLLGMSQQYTGRWLRAYLPNLFVLTK